MPLYIPNFQHTSLSHVEVCSCMNSSCTSQRISQQPVRIELCFKFLNTVPVFGKSHNIIRMIYSFWRLKSIPTTLRLAYASNEHFSTYSLFNTPVSQTRAGLHTNFPVQHKVFNGESHHFSYPHITVSFNHLYLPVFVLDEEGGGGGGQMR